MATKRKKVTDPVRQRRAALYCRVSTFDQNRGDYSSLEDQESRLRRAAEAEGYEVYDIYKEVASSATMERDQLRRLLAELEHFDAVFVTKLDRLSRSMHDWCAINERMDECHVALVCTTQKIDTSTPMGRFFRDLLMLFAQFEREMIAERTYEKMAEQARRGCWGGGHQILGYDAVGKKLTLNETEAVLVRALFTKYLELGPVAHGALGQPPGLPDQASEVCFGPASAAAEVSPGGCVPHPHQRTLRRQGPLRRNGLSRRAPGDHR
jgi:DNA invertase Pin-like site-specific DNA recombinase